jgi:hypothetical protein
MKNNFTDEEIEKLKEILEEYEKEKEINLDW